MEVPEQLQKALRLVFAVCLAVGTGISVLLALDPEQYPQVYRQVKLATAGAGITTVISQSPVIGQMARAGVENIIGTIIGGWTGYGVYMLSDFLLHDYPTEPIPYEWIFRACCAPLIAFMGAMFGWVVGWEVSGRLVLLTYLLVVLNNEQPEVAFMFACSRTLAIIAGIVANEVAHAIVFPKSASVQALTLLRRAISSLAQLNKLTIEHASKRGRDQSLPQLRGPPGAARSRTAITLDPSAVEEETEQLHAVIHASLNGALAMLPITRNEAYVCRSGNSWCFLPGSSSMHCGWQMPIAKLQQVIWHVRRTTRLLYHLLLLLQEGVQELLQSALKDRYPEVLLQQLLESMQGTLEDMSAPLLTYGVLASKNLIAFRIRVEQLCDLIHSGNEAYEMAGALRQASVAAMGMYWPPSMMRGPRGSGMSGPLAYVPMAPAPIESHNIQTSEASVAASEAYTATSGMSYTDTADTRSEGTGAASGLTFPNTPEGQVAQVRAMALCFLMQKAQAEMEGMYNTLCALLEDLPGMRLVGFPGL